MLTTPIRVAQRFLQAAAMGADDLPDGWYVDIEPVGRSTLFTLIDSDGMGAGGHIKIQWNSRCDAWEVVHSIARGGWGPFLYDLAMEFTGDKGLIPDRLSVSPEAERVWSYYARRSDVRQLPLPDGCRLHADLRGDNPLDFRYVKTTRGVIPKLKATGRWRT